MDTTLRISKLELGALFDGKLTTRSMCHFDGLGGRFPCGGLPVHAGFCRREDPVVDGLDVLDCELLLMPKVPPELFPARLLSQQGIPSTVDFSVDTNLSRFS